MKRLTLVELERAYQSGVYGNMAPTHLRIHPSHEPIVREALGATKAPPGAVLQFHDAAIIYTPEITPDFIEVLHIKYMCHKGLSFSTKIESHEICPCCYQEIATSAIRP